jgi:hypothetical protein
MVHPNHYIKLLLVFSLLSYNAAANEALTPVNFSGHYSFTLAGIPFGKADLAFTQAPAAYKATADVATTGIARVFVQHKSRSVSSGTGSDYQYGNVDYESNYETKKKPRHTKWEKKEGVFVSEVVLPPDNRNTRAAVPQAQKQGAFDPVVFTLAVRGKLAESLKNGQKAFSVHMYDGRRLTRADFTLNGETVIKIGGKSYPVYRLFGRRTAIAGYTQKELSRIEPNEPTMTIYFSRDAKMIPLRLEVPFMFGMVAATLKM